MKKYLPQIKTLLPVIAVALVMVFSFTDFAQAAFDAESQAKSVLKFIALIILIAAGVGALTMITKGFIAQALLLVIGASLLYFLLGSPEIIHDIGNGISNLFFGEGS